MFLRFAEYSVGTPASLSRLRFSVRCAPRKWRNERARTQCIVPPSALQKEMTEKGRIGKNEIADFASNRLPFLPTCFKIARFVRRGSFVPWRFFKTVIVCPTNVERMASDWPILVNILLLGLIIISGFLSYRIYYYCLKLYNYLSFV